MYISPPSWASLPSSTPSHPSGWSSLHPIANSHWLSILHMVNVYVSMLLFQLFHPFLPLRFPGGLHGKTSTLSKDVLGLILGREDPLEKEMATHSTTLACKIPWAEEPGRLQSMGSQRVGHDWATSLSFISLLSLSPDVPQVSSLYLHLYSQLTSIHKWKKMVLKFIWGRKESQRASWLHNLL